MGKIVSAVTKPVGKLAGGVLGAGGGLVNQVLSPFGLGGEQGAYATPEEYYKRQYEKAASDYAGGMKDAEKGVQESALTKGLFGTGGLNEQLAKEQADLSGRGYSLQPEDYEAYGQASGDIARLFGQQEQSAAKALARRGLGAAGSGAAGAAFSGLAGNKNEMLANQQRQIANQRMENTRARLADTRNMMQSLGMQGSQLANQRYQDRLSGLKGAAGMETQRYLENANALADKEAAKGETLFGAIGKGILSAGQKAPGALLGKATGMGFGGGSGPGGTT